MDLVSPDAAAKTLEYCQSKKTAERHSLLRLMQPKEAELTQAEWSQPDAEPQTATRL